MNLSKTKPRGLRGPLTASHQLGDRCGAWEFGDADRCLQPTGGVSDCCLEHRSPGAGPRCQYVLGVDTETLSLEVCGAPCYDRLCPDHTVVGPERARSLADFRPVGTDVRDAR